MLAGCTYPSRGITTPQKCASDFLQWNPDESYYDLGRDGRVTLALSRSFAPELGVGFEITTEPGSWSESASTVTVTWDRAAMFPHTRALDRTDAVTLRDGFISFDMQFWFVKAR